MDSKTKLKKDITNLIEINNLYKIKLHELNHIKEQKQKQEDLIHNSLKILNLEEKIFVFNDNKIQHKKVFQYQNYSIKYLEKCLNEYIDDNEIRFNIKDFLQIVKQNREKKIKDEIKIY